jgi:hypothetical protein
MATPRLPPECADCQQRPRTGHSTRCEQCRNKHRRERQPSTQRERRQRPSGSIHAPAESDAQPREPYPRVDPGEQERIRAVEQALRYSTPYVAYLHERIGPTPYLDDLHTAISDLLRHLSSDR